MRAKLGLGEHARTEAEERAACAFLAGARAVLAGLSPDPCPFAEEDAREAWRAAYRMRQRVR